MTPTERAVQSRIKEAFALKLAPNVWQEAVRQLSNAVFVHTPVKLTHDQLDAAFEDNQRYRFHKEDVDRKLTCTFYSSLLCLAEVEEDPLVSSSAQALFLADEPMWEGVDSMKGEVQLDPSLYRLFKQFLFDYFLPDQHSLETDAKGANKWCSSI